ncbi:MAG: amino acid ABC transporter permease [Rhodobacteraceae bacterium]|jgi:polar amino acid transport system permease protein|nr:amino acid ABC transporter permease [Paracoccaceae bacterium]MBT6298176.1 amino acid ABC transporter permease [Paracoccaceae bacterium]MBT6543312.1 amino acid ABC transporter permease [Paracoccaceae bacterium]HBS38265.1 polar amino acid ABC transporter permease [Paracoccaceae bacterium]
MKQFCLNLPTPRSDRTKQSKTFNFAYATRSLSSLVLALLIFASLGYLIWRGAAAMEYRWQWYRIEPFFFRSVDDEIIWGPLIKGLIQTLKLAGTAGVFAIIIGLFTAFARLSNSVSGRIISTCYLEAIRNTPLLVQLFLFYFVLAPIFGIDRFWAGVLCLAFYEGSFAAEIIRSGILGVDRGQFESADAIGLSVLNKYKDIIIPQSLPLILPPLTGLIISLIKHSAIVSVIAVAELTTAGLNLIADTFMAFEVWFLVAGIYLALTVTLSFGISIFEWSLKSRGN